MPDRLGLTCHFETYEASSTYWLNCLRDVLRQLRDYPNSGAREPGAKTAGCDPAAGAGERPDGRSGPEPLERASGSVEPGQ